MTLNEIVTILGEGTIMVLVTLAVYGIVISMVGGWTLLGNFNNRLKSSLLKSSLLKSSLLKSILVDYYLEEKKKFNYYDTDKDKMIYKHSLILLENIYFKIFKKEISKDM